MVMSSSVDVESEGSGMKFRLSESISDEDVITQAQSFNRIGDQSPGITTKMTKEDITSLKKRREVCEHCSEFHPHLSCCPKMPCKICYKHGHNHNYCLYNWGIPQGAKFDSDKYHVVCGSCGFAIDTEVWLCTYCSMPMPKVKPKYCEFCSVIEDHNTIECPKDKTNAALLKSRRDTFLKTRTRTTCPLFEEFLAAKRAQGEYI